MCSIRQASASAVLGSTPAAIATLGLEDGQSIVTALDHGIPIHHLRGLRGQLNANLAGLVADVDNHVVIRGGAGLIQESGGQFDSILLTDAIAIGIYISNILVLHFNSGVDG